MSLSKSHGGGESRTPASRDADHRITIGEMAQLFNVSHRTLRFYEDRGLLVPTREGTARYYTGRDKARLKRILHGKQLGFTLTEIRDMLAQPDKGSASTELALKPDQIVAQIAYLEQQRNDIEGAILQLRRAQDMLTAR